MPRPKVEDPGVRIHIRLTRKQYAKVQKLAGNGGYSISETLRRAVDSYLAFVESKHM